MEDNQSVILMRTANFNLDNNLEVMVCVFNNFVLPSYSKWTIYKYENGELIFIEQIYDGTIKYKLIHWLVLLFTHNCISLSVS